jgi:GAF domain-containing protein
MVRKDDVAGEMSPSRCSSNGSWLIARNRPRSAAGTIVLARRLYVTSHRQVCGKRIDGGAVENTQHVVTEFVTIFDRDGLHDALAFLNARTRHRYTGLYRFEPPMLRNLCLYDRENPRLHVGGDSPMDETYCSIVGERAAPFATPDALGDECLATHPARADVQAYCGAPVTDGVGRCVGTLCHFDVRPRLVPETEIPIMEQLARLLSPVVRGERLPA